MTMSMKVITKSIDKNGKDKGYITRPNASPGYWLCALVPLCYIVDNYRYPQNSLSFDYKMTTIVAFGIFIQSIVIILNLWLSFRKYLNAIYTLIPAGLTSFLIWICLKQEISVSCFWGTGSTVLYSLLYYKALKALPKSFTFGEASVIVQGFTLFLLNACLQIPSNVQTPPAGDMAEMNAIMIAALICLAITVWLIYSIRVLRNVFVFYFLMVMLVVTVCIVPVTEELPIVTLLTFITGDMKRICIIIVYLGLVGLTVATISWRLGKTNKASTSIRKIFHILVVCVFIPGLLYHCTLLYIATGVALAFITVFEVFRLTKIPPFEDVLNKSFEVFADEKDAGYVALTPFYLLVGCSLPMWLNPSPCMISDTAGYNLFPLLAGVLSIGIGDTTASVVGSSIGRMHWPGSSKTVEGTVASIVAQGLTMFGLYSLQYFTITEYSAIVLGFAIIVTSIAEALTDQVDNLVLPLIFYILCATRY